jgi:hypothetical protein
MPQPDAGAGAAARGGELGTAWAFRALSLSRDATFADAKRAYHRCARPAQQPRLATHGDRRWRSGRRSGRRVVLCTRPNSRSAPPRPRSVLKTAHPDKGGDADRFLQARPRRGCAPQRRRAAQLTHPDATPLACGTRQVQRALQAVLQDIERACARDWDWRQGCGAAAAAGGAAHA